MRPGRRRDRSPARDDEHGYVILWMVIVLVLLLSVAAFSVDLVHAYVEGDRAQKAADAAALAGAVAIPKDQSVGFAAAKARAVELAADNGFTPGGDVTVTPTVTGPNEMTVEVSSTIDTFFAKIIGFKTLTVRRKAVAQYDPPAPMGSASNNLGDVPYCPLGMSGTSCLNDPAATKQRLWANVQGPNGRKVNGNAITEILCTNGPAVDECTGNSNNENDPTGERFKVASDGSGPLDIWIYDAAFVATGIDCRTNNPSGASSYNNANPVHKQVFDNYNNQDYCSGDSSFADFDPPVTTQYTVNSPDGTQVCQSPVIPGFGLTGELIRTTPNKAFANPLTRDMFHQWYKLCSIATPDVGEYNINVNALSGIGNNQFSILALHGSAPPPDNLNVYTRELLPMLAANPDGGTSKFYLARILPSNHQRDLALDFFDLGDNSFPPNISKGTLEIVTRGVNAGFSPGPCLYVPPPSTGSPSRNLPFPLGSFVTDPDCTLNYDASGGSAATWNGRWVSFHISLPPKGSPGGYDCDSTQFTNCWIQVKITPEGGSALSDATTWRAHLQGLPVRLVG